MPLPVVRIGLVILVALTTLLAARNGLAVVWLPGFEPGADWLYHAIEVGAVVMCAARAYSDPRSRAAWWSLTAGMALFAAGDLYWTVVLAQLPDVPYPSLADLGYLAIYPGAYAALLLVVRSRSEGVSLSVWLDGLIGVLALGSVCAAAILPELIEVSGGSVAVVATNLAYPAGDVLLLLLVTWVALLGSWKIGRTWLLAAVGFVVFAGVDVLYLLQVARGTYVEGTLLDVGWPAAFVLLAFAAWQKPQPVASRRLQSWAGLALPAVFALTGIVVLVVDHFHRLSVAAVLLAAAALVAVIARFGVTFAESVRVLTASRHAAVTDSLTGLANRALFEQRLRQALAARHRTGGRVGVLVLDLDEFKTVNDSLGHAAGDTLLTVIAQRLKAATRESDTVARLGGDEFAVLLEHPGDLHAVAALANRLLGDLAQPVQLAGRWVYAHASIGIALSEPPGRAVADERAEGMELLRSADVAMYAAKAQGRNRSEVFAPHMHAAALDRLERVAELQRALDGDELRLQFQPIVDLETGEIEGAEALVRWQHPVRGLVPPGEFIPLAEETGLIVPLGTWVLREACREATRWREELPDGARLYVSVNIGGQQLQHIRFVDEVEDVLADSGLPARCLMLEVTESSLLEDTTTNAQRLQSLRDLGVRLAVDDFGTGYSALNYLRRFRMDILKIDRSFIDGVESPSEQSALVDAILAMAAALDLRVVAEGIESHRQLAHLRERACPLGQGFLFARPLDGVQLTELLGRETHPLSAA